MTAKKFSDFGIKTADQKSFVGDKIKMKKILNCEITVYGFRFDPSKYGGKYMCMQIDHKGEKHIVFTISVGLIDAIQQVPLTEFPFITTIVSENDRFLFT